MISSDARRLGQEAARRLARMGRGCETGPGLTAAEFARIERDYEFEFADDHRAFLAAGLPLSSAVPWRRGNPWPDWRDGEPDELRKRLAWPVEGALAGPDDSYSQVSRRAAPGRPSGRTPGAGAAGAAARSAVALMGLGGGPGRPGIPDLRSEVP